MTRYRAIDIIENEIECVNRQDTCEHKCADCELVLPDIEIFEAYDMAIKALSQEPCELLIIKSDILLHQDDRKKWMESIKREKESGVIILPPYFEPLLVPADIEINIEQEPCDDAISRDAVLDALLDYWHDIQFVDGSGYDVYEDCKAVIDELPSVTHKSAKDYLDMADRKAKKIKDALTVTQKLGYWIRSLIYEGTYNCSKCGSAGYDTFNYCPNCGAKMVEPQESEEV